MSDMIISQNKLDFLDWEFGVFFHFGIRTFYEGHKDWDMKPMDVNGFCPTELDCKQWIRTVKEAGAKYAILVCKHHDGFANWPSAYTEYSVKNTPWKNGKGDVVREFVDACKAYDIKVGLYYSPAQFGSVHMNAKEYDDYFINQISELLTGYGKIDYLWFDGCGSENHQYDTERIVKAIRSMQPDILLFNMWDPDTRWVGNECGIAHMPNHNIVKEVDFSVMTTKKDTLEQASFLPVECDCMMRHRNWFYSDLDEDTVKSLEELMGLYLYSVGRGANLLINIGPDRRGLLPDKDANRLLEFGKEIKRRFGSPVVAVNSPKAEPITETNGNHDLKRSRYFVELPEKTLIRNVMLKEDILTGEKIREVKIYVVPYLNGSPVLVNYSFSVGHKLIADFPAVSTSKVIIEIAGQEGYKLTDIEVYQ